MICYLVLVESLLATESRYLTSRDHPAEQQTGPMARSVSSPSARPPARPVSHRGPWHNGRICRTVPGRHAVDTREIVDVHGSGLGTLRGAPKEAQPRNGELEVLLAVASRTGGSANPVEVLSCP
jgi:hypothetical protein